MPKMGVKVMENKKCLECNNDLQGRQKYFCSNKCKLCNKDNIKLRTKPRDEKNDSSKRIKCKIDGKIFKDIHNYSGCLTRHLLSLNIQSLDIFDYFEIIDNQCNMIMYNCKYCDWKTKDIDNKSGCITSHLKNKHDLEPIDHIEKYPEDEKIWSYTHSKALRDHFLSMDRESYIECKECNMKLKRITISHLKLHGMSPDEYRLKYNVNTLSSKNFIKNSKDLYFEKFDNINKEIKRSKAEGEIKDFLNEYKINVKIGDRKILYPLELDLFLPDYNIGIEYNGLRWHSEFYGKKMKDFHLNKLKKCEDKNIHLIQIFEDEWIYKKDIVKQRLLHILGVISNRIHARKCIIKEIENDIKNKFLEKNHLQGKDKSNINFGLYYNDILVSVMTFSFLRKSLGFTRKDNEYELSRFSSITNIPGAASKLLNGFIKKYKPIKIISYADRRWTSGIKKTLYESIGFIREKSTKPNYWYMSNYHSRLHRFNFTKNRIVSKLGGNQNLTEVENMIKLGYDRIWDCGSFKFVMNL